MSIDDDGSIRNEVVVNLDQVQAFWLFADLDKFKPREHNMLQVPIQETVVERHVGGDVYDRGEDGSICRWARILRFDPPHAFGFTWDIGPDWQVTTDLEHTSEVEVTFEPTSDGATQVTLVHRHVERHGSGWESLRDGLDAGNGWPLYLQRYEDLAGEQSVR